jgi:hypothetical protein
LRHCDAHQMRPLCGRQKHRSGGSIRTSSAAPRPEPKSIAGSNPAPDEKTRRPSARCTSKRPFGRKLVAEAAFEPVPPRRGRNQNRSQVRTLPPMRHRGGRQHAARCHGPSAASW